MLPGLLNEYRIPELNVQNGVLKSLSFLFEYIGEMGRDYVYAVVPLLEARAAPPRPRETPSPREPPLELPLTHL